MDLVTGRIRPILLLFQTGSIMEFFKASVHNDVNMSSPTYSYDCVAQIVWHWEDNPEAQGVIPRRLPFSPLFSSMVSDLLVSCNRSLL